jgi:hypothetical protein
LYTEKVSIPDPSDPDTTIPTTKLNLEGTFVCGDIGSYSFHLFSYGKKVAEVKDGRLYKVFANGARDSVEGFSKYRDVNFEIYLRCFVDLIGNIVKTEGTLFSTLEKEFLTEMSHPEEEETAFSRLVNFLREYSVATNADVYTWTEENKSTLYDSKPTVLLNVNRSFFTLNLDGNKAC